MKVKVHLQCYVEQCAVMEVEADTVKQAIDIALTDAAEAAWVEGDDAYDTTVYCVTDMNNEVIWEQP